MKFSLNNAFLGIINGPELNRQYAKINMFALKFALWAYLPHREIKITFRTLIKQRTFELQIYLSQQTRIKMLRALFSAYWLKFLAFSWPTKLETYQRNSCLLISRMPCNMNRNEHKIYLLSLGRKKSII